MVALTIRGNPFHIKHDPIKIGDILNFTARDKDMKLVDLSQFTNKLKIITSVPSIDTKTCSLQTIEFNNEAAKLKDLVIITISKDLPFAQTRFCEKLKLNHNFYLWSDYSCDKTNFSNQTKLLIDETQLLARSVIILDANNKVLYLQIVKEVTSQPDYEAILTFLKSLK